MTARVEGVVLAAGAATRMGRTKQLLPYRGKTLLEWVVDAALASSLHRVVVVVGHDAERVGALLARRPVSVVLNPDYASGQGSSTRMGVEAVAEDADAALFLLGDQPLVTPAVMQRVLEAYEAHRAPIVLPEFRGRRGNPALFDRETFPRLRALPPDAGARSLFEAYSDRILRVAVPDPVIHFDVDTEEDYLRLLERDSRGEG